MSPSLIVLGAGGHARAVADALLLAGEKVLGFTDPDPAKVGTVLLGLPVLGGDDVLASLNPSEVLLVNGLGSIKGESGRRVLQQRLVAAGWSFARVQHPTAFLSPFTQVSSGVQFMAGCLVQTDSRIGEGTIVNTGAILEHDTDIGVFVHVAPGAVVCGGVIIGDHSHIGAGAVIRQGLQLGPRTIVGAGSVVVKPFEGEGMLVGVPAKVRDRG